MSNRLVSTTPDGILREIDVHRLAHERLERASDAADDVRAGQEGREVTEADQAEWAAAGKAETRALARLMRTRATTVAGLIALLRYAAKSRKRQCWDQRVVMPQLYESIRESTPVRALSAEARRRLIKAASLASAKQAVYDVVPLYR